MCKPKQSPNRPMFVYEGVESQPVAPARAEVLDVDTGIPCRLALGPFEQRLFGRLFIGTLVNLSNLESENDDPDKTENKRVVAVYDVLGPD